jgi:hypothetical protein
MELLRRLWSFLVQVFTHPQPPAPAETHTPEQGVEDYLELLNRHPGTRVTTVRTLGHRASDDGTVFVHEHIETADEQGNARQIDIFDGRTCSCGHVLDQQVRPTSVCAICSAILCSSGAGSPDACSKSCSMCNSPVCAADRTTFDLGKGQSITYCSRHRWRHYWRLWWGLYS